MLFNERPNTFCEECMQKEFRLRISTAMIKSCGFISMPKYEYIKEN
jgi:hypothetical protein